MRKEIIEIRELENGGLWQAYRLIDDDGVCILADFEVLDDEQAEAS